MAWSDRLFQEELKARGSVVQLELQENATVVTVKGGIQVPLTAGSITLKEREENPLLKGKDNVDVIVHPDGSVSLKTFRYVTNIPLSELELLVKLARAAASGELPAEKQPEGKAGPTEKVEVPF